MIPYYTDSRVTIYHGDCREILPSIEPVDLVLTDPPYGYSFMGKDWDTAVPDIEVWRECLRVLKPGAFAFVMCAPRQDCLGKMICNLSDAGFETGFSSIYWTYASGFPKAQDIGKAVDKRNGKPRRSVALEGYLAERVRQVYGKHTALASEMGVAESLIRHWTGKCGDQFLIPTKQQFTVLKTKLGLDDRFDELIEWEEAKREIIGKSDNKIHFENLGQAGYKDKWDITAPARLDAQALDGSYAGFQPKPAVEVILVCMKPLSEKTYVEQALKNQKGVTWLDEGRIPYESDRDMMPVHGYMGEDAMGAMKGEPVKGNPTYTQPSGRFPANLLVSDDVLDDGRDSKGSHDQQVFVKKHGGIFGEIGVYDGIGYGDSGSFSRYFDIDRWWAERVKQLPESVQQTFPFLIVPKASKAEKNRGCEGLPDRERPTMGKGLTGISGDRTGTGKQTITAGSNTLKNYHPTVKPLKLMSYLITLGSREGDVILDPFVGSGTTCLAAQLLGRKCIGIESEESFCEIAANRCRQMVMEF